MEKKLVSLLLAVALVLSLAACGPTSTTAATAAVTEASAVGSYHSFYADQEPEYVPALPWAEPPKPPERGIPSAPAC